MHNDQESDFFPGIEEYLDNINDNSDINLKNIEELIYIVRSKTALSYEQCEIIIKEIFTNIRNEIIKKNKIVLKNLGTFYIGKNKRIYFKTPKNVKSRINGK